MMHRAALAHPPRGCPSDHGPFGNMNLHPTTMGYSPQRCPRNWPPPKMARFGNRCHLASLLGDVEVNGSAWKHHFPYNHSRPSNHGDMQVKIAPWNKKKTFHIQLKLATHPWPVQVHRAPKIIRFSSSSTWHAPKGCVSDQGHMKDKVLHPLALGRSLMGCVNDRNPSKETRFCIPLLLAAHRGDVQVTTVT